MIRTSKVRKQSDGSGRVGGILLIILLTASLGASPMLFSGELSFATFPGNNGKIAFASDRRGFDFELFEMNAADGKGLVRLTDSTDDPDFFQIFTEPEWSPDGTVLAFVYNLGGSYSIATTTGVLTEETALVSGPSWSPDGEKIAFSTGEFESIVTIGPDNWHDETVLTQGLHPSWSPIGTKIAFTSDRDGDAEIYTISESGGDITKLTDNNFDDRDPDWGGASSPEESQCSEAATITGTDGPDDIQGTPGPDIIDAKGGDDVINGLDGDDMICGGSGGDEIQGGDGSDTVFGGLGSDEIFGGNDRDTIYGEVGDDIINGGAGTDRLEGGHGDDVLVGGWGPDKMIGGVDNDRLNGGNGNDQIHGGSGNDSINGGAGSDIMFGEPGRDLIESRDGIVDNDFINGGGISGSEGGEDVDTCFSDPDPEVECEI